MWHNTMNTLMQLKALKRHGLTVHKVREKRWYVLALVHSDGHGFETGPYRTRRDAMHYANALGNVY